MKQRFLYSLHALKLIPEPLRLLMLVLLNLLAIDYLIDNVLPVWDANPRLGIGEYVRSDGEIVPAKTLWDLLELLIVPAMLALGALWFNNQTRERERAHEERRVQEQRALEQDRFKEEALQTYFDRMTELLLKEKLKNPEAPEEVKRVATLRTITVLRRLDRRRRGEVTSFLQDSGLLNEESSIFAGETLTGVNLSGANLSEANLSGASLGGANLSEANLRGANLRKAALIMATLTEAGLHKADLSDGYLWLADLDRADLSGANLTGVKDVTPEQLAKAVLDEKTIMPDGKPLNESSFMKQDGSSTP